MTVTGARGLKSLRIKHGPLSQIGLSPKSWRIDETFSVDLKSTVDQLQTSPSNFTWKARACSGRQSRSLRSIMMRLAAHPNGILARDYKTARHILAFHATIHNLERLIGQQVKKLVDLPERWIQLTRVAMN